jgi:hypothetical protein
MVPNLHRAIAVMRCCASLTLIALLLTACGGRVVRVPQAVPAYVQRGLASVSHVWVAGFVTSGRQDIDLNAESVRLVRKDLRAWSGARIVEAEPLQLRDEGAFQDVDYWRRLGEEHGEPLIVTGSVKLMLAPAQIVQRGKRTYYLPTGRTLEATVVLIDGRTGEVRAERKLPSRMKYSEGVVTSGLALFYQMMDQARSDWLAAISDTPTTSTDARK